MIAKKPLPLQVFHNHPWPFLLGFSAALLALRIAYLMLWTPYGLAPDEAQYWHWLSHPALAYVTKPALTTWAMGLSTHFLGNTLLGVKAFALLAQVLLPILAYWIVREAGGRPLAAWLAFAALTGMPLLAGGGLVMSPDAVLTPLWFAGLLVLLPETKARHMTPWRWLAAGLLLGLGGLAKYSAGAFFPLLGVYTMLHRRDWLKRPLFHLSGAVGLVLQIPTLYWNATHHWDGFKHILWQTNGGGDKRHGGISSLVDFLLNQVGVLGLLGFALLVVGLVLGVKRYKTLTAPARLMFWLAVPVLLGFTALSVTTKVQANWPILGTLGCVILGALLLPAAKSWWKCAVWVVPLWLIGAAFSMALYDTPLLHKLGVLNIKHDPTKELLGYRELGYVTGLKLATLDKPHVLLTSRYQTTAEMAFNVEEHPQVLYVNPGAKRMTEYDLWDWPDLEHTLVLYVNEQEELPAAVAKRFNNCQPYGSVQVAVHNQEYRNAYYWVCWEDKYSPAARAAAKAATVSGTTP